MSRLLINACFLLMLFLGAGLCACDDPTTSMVVAYEETDIHRRPLRVIVALPDGTISTASLAYGESITFRSLYEGAYGVKAVVDASYIEQIRQKRDSLILELAEADLLGEQISSEKRAEINSELDALIQWVNKEGEMSGATACTVEPESSGNVGI